MKQDTLLMFDLDGTMWDSAQSVAESWNEVFRRADPSLKDLTADDVHSVMGMTMKEISQVLQMNAAGMRWNTSTIIRACCIRICGRRWRNCGRTDTP